MALKQDWKLPLKIEHQFGKLLVKQKKKGFLVDKKLIEKHITTLNRYINNIDRVTVPLLPLRCVPQVKKSKGIFPYVKKVFLQSGGYTDATTKWIDMAYPDGDPDICNVFTRISFIEFNLGSSAQVKTYLLNAGWKPEKYNFSKLTGERTSPVLSGDDSFIGVNGKIGKIIAKRMKYRHRLSQLEGFLKLIRPDGRITGDVSGICPTARLKHKGIVNIPGSDALFGNRMRSVFIVPVGYNLIGCDAASCQLRMLCHYMQDEKYTYAVVNGKEKDGTDIHSVNMGIAGCKSRSDAKTLIYAILFGAGDAKLASQLGCTTKEAAIMRNRFLNNLPKLKALVSSLKKVWKKRGYLIGLDGRKIFVRSEHMLLVYLLQSAEAIMIKVATLYAHKYCAAFDACMVVHQHDEYQWEVKEEESEKIAELLEESIVKAGEFLNLNVPMGGTSKIGLNWRETH